jgi:acetyl/propionyl-CoA carboxylase alpha subunit
MRISIDIKGQRVQLAVQIINGVLWAHHEGKTYTFENPDLLKKRGKKTHQARNPFEIIAPMPGKVTKILVKESDTVKMGQPLLIMEAMKMEYTLKAEADASVQKVDCKLGDQVVLGKKLILLKEVTA